MIVIVSSSSDSSRTSNGILYPRKRFIPSENRFYLGLYKSRDRLRCIRLCQESSVCQTIIFDRMKHECQLFSEHVEYGSGRLDEENNENLITIRLDKSLLHDLHQMIKNKRTRAKIVPSYRKPDEEICDNCEL
jgi:hypothetical protein